MNFTQFSDKTSRISIEIEMRDREYQREGEDVRDGATAANMRIKEVMRLANSPLYTCRVQDSESLCEEMERERQCTNKWKYRGINELRDP